MAQDFSVFATYHSNPYRIPGCQMVPLDIRNRQEVMSAISGIKPAVVIHTAAVVNVDYCEEHPEEAWDTNVIGTENVALSAKEAGARLIYISTDSVFDGEKGMYAETDTPHPVNTYGRSKLEGEGKVQQCLPDALIVRTAFYGWSPNQSNRPSLSEWVVTNLRQGKILNMFTDVFFSPIFTSNLSAVITALYDKDGTGIYHVGGRERCSKFAFGLAIAAAFGLDKSLIRPCSIADAGLKAPRPKDISLDVAKVAGVLKNRLLDVKEGIALFKAAQDLRMVPG